MRPSTHSLSSGPARARCHHADRLARGSASLLLLTFHLMLGVGCTTAGVTVPAAYREGTGDVRAGEACSPADAYALGRDGHRATPRQCPEEMRDEYLAAWEHGHDVMLAAEAVRRVEVALRHNRQELDAVRLDRRDAQGGVTALQGTAAERHHQFRELQRLLARERELTAARETLNARLADTEAALTDKLRMTAAR